MGHPAKTLSRTEHHCAMAESDSRPRERSGPLGTVMRIAQIYQQDVRAGVLEALDSGGYRFTYEAGYNGEPVSLTMPMHQRVWEFSQFPPPFEGLLPEGVQLDALLRRRKLDKADLFGQLLAVGEDVVGSLQIKPTP